MGKAYDPSKEYLRLAFMKGWLDVSASVKSVSGFVDVMAGEMEAIVAIEQCRFLTDVERNDLLARAKPTVEVVREFERWRNGFRRGGG